MNTCAIKLGGKKRTLKFNINSDAILCEGISTVVGRPVLVEEFPSFMLPIKDEEGNFHDNLTYQTRFIIWMIYSGLHNYLEANNKPDEIEKLNYHTVADWMDDLNPEDSKRVAETWMKTRILKRESNNGQKRKGKGEEKKN